MPDTIGQGNLKGHHPVRTRLPKLVLQRGHLKQDITTTSGRLHTINTATAQKYLNMKENVGTERHERGLRYFFESVAASSPLQRRRITM